MMTIEATVKSLEPFHATVHNVKQCGWTRSEIEAAIRRGTIAWTRDGNLETKGSK